MISFYEFCEPLWLVKPIEEVVGTSGLQLVGKKHGGDKLDLLLVSEVGKLCVPEPFTIETGCRARGPQDLHSPWLGHGGNRLR